jgi:DNA-binding Lrp family transcriptional regulator
VGSDETSGEGRIAAGRRRPEGTARDVDAIDRRLVDLLRVDGRASVSELAARAGISRANAYQRLGRMRSTGAITAFTVRTDPHRLGLDVTAFILVSGEQRTWRELRAELGQLPGVEYVALTAGSHDFVLLVRVPDVETLRDVVLDGLQSMRGVRSTQTMFVLDEDDRRT